MADAASAPQSPRHLHKRRRLSRLLDKLTVQITNNNYTSQRCRWLTLHSPLSDSGKKSQDAPLDLSVKSIEIEKTHSPPVTDTDSDRFICGACGETFGLHDRLAKHVASRHRNRTPDSARAYECEICLRKFARSDMLTRHARLHSGIKPYSCSVCGQTFSRSDHLATHQRTHTGVKPYHCSACPYAACRRDMITRHMKIHSRRSHSLL